MDNSVIKKLSEELADNLNNNILPYWLRLEDPAGGYFGRKDSSETLHPEEPRGCILNARILWTFAAAARATGNQEYADAARRQFAWFTKHFIDPEYGGCYWSVNADDTPLDTKKQFYAIAFSIYALSEYYMLTKDEKALNTAIDLFHIIETHSRDHNGEGYFEATTRDWQPIGDMRLSDKDLNSSKTMNTHLHILEGYTNLLRVWRTDESIEATASLLRLFNDTIVDKDSNHMGLFFDDNMQRVDHAISYGHDIEASWLMLEAAEVIGNKALYEETKEVTRKLALAALEGLQPDGSLIYERHEDGRLDSERHWWVQAENIVGLTYLARYHDMPEALDKALRCWDYVKANIVDTENGEWWGSRLPDGTINRREDKAGFWKCPYHNSRMCLETLRQLPNIKIHHAHHAITS